MFGRKESRAILWLGFEKMAALGLSFLATIVVARHLGPANLGILASGLAIVSILSPLASLLIDKALVRRFSREPEQRDYLLFLARHIVVRASILTFLVGLVLIAILSTSSDGTSGLRFLVGLSALLSLLIFPFLVPLRSFCESITNGKILATSNLSGSVGASLFRLVMVAIGAPLPLFAFSGAVGAALSAGVLRAHFGRIGKWFLPDFKAARREKTFLAEGSILAFAALTNLIHRNVDIIMVERLANSTEAGNYAASARLAEITYLIPVILATVYLPLLSRSRDNASSFHNSTLNFFRLNTLFALVITMAGLLCGKPIIDLLYGSQFSMVGTIFLIHIASIWFIFIDHAKGTVLTSNRGNPVVIWCNAIAITVNVGLNFLLIPKYGGIGAASATFVSYSLIGAILPFLFAETRKLARMQIRALISPIQVLGQLRSS
tara:strand:+ start:238 stop:1545 length:1308 start_codon:yes stop_codon:yes gene_type:complete